MIGKNAKNLQSDIGYQHQQVNDSIRWEPVK